MQTTEHISSGPINQACADLVVQARDGNRAAFGDLVVRHEQSLNVLCNRLTRDSQAAEDLAIEAFTEAYVKIEQLRDPERFSGWLHQIAMNLFRSGYRRRAREREAIQKNAFEDPGDDLDESDLNSAFLEVGPAHQEVLVLHYWERLSCEEIADYLEIPVGTVLSRLHRARGAVRTRMENPGSDGETQMNDSQLRRDIDLELDLLQKIEKPVDQASERLSLILTKNPEKFAALIRVVDDEEHLRHLGSLIRRIRKPVMEAALASWFTSDDALRERTGNVLDAWVAGQKTGGKPRRDIFAFVDLVIGYDVSDADKAELLVHFASMTQRLKHSCPWILIDVTTAYPELATELLFPLFLKQKLVDGQFIAHGVPATLWKMPAQFCERLLDHVLADDAEVSHRSINGFLRASRNFHYDRHGAVIDRLLGRLDQMWDAASDAERDKLLPLFGAIKNPPSTERLRNLLAEASEGLRVRILSQLVHRGCNDVVPDLMEYGRSRDRKLQRTALRTLLTNRVEDAKPLFRELMDDPDRDVQRMGITGFGAVADRFDETVLRDLMRSGDKKLAKIAARAFRTKPREKTELEANRIKRIRGDAEPHMHMSPIDAIQALPEIRSYTEQELSGIIAGICTDWATTRRHLVMGYGVNDRLMVREKSIYELTELGESVWRVGQFLKDRGIRRTVIGKWKNE